MSDISVGGYTISFSAAWQFFDRTEALSVLINHAIAFGVSKGDVVMCLLNAPRIGVFHLMRTALLGWAGFWTDHPVYDDPSGWVPLGRE